MPLNPFDSMLHQEVASSSSESLSFMMEQECTTYSSCNYLHDDGDNASGSACTDEASCGDDSNCSSSATVHHWPDFDDEKITPIDRRKLIDWCYAIADRCQFQRETVAVAANIVDRFMSTTRASSASSQEIEALYDRTEYQLVALTALYISIKINERTSFGIKDFAAASRGIYPVEDIEVMELKILHALSWRVCPPTSVQMGNQILALMLPEESNSRSGTFEFLREEVAFQMENAVRDYYLATQRPSTIAAAAIMNAIESNGNQGCDHLTEALTCILREFSFESYDVLLHVRNHLFRLVNEEEGEENSLAMMSERTRLPHAEERALDIYYRLVQDTQLTISSPRSVICDDDMWDENSCATTYMY